MEDPKRGDLQYLNTHRYYMIVLRLFHVRNQKCQHMQKLSDGIWWHGTYKMVMLYVLCHLDGIDARRFLELDGFADDEINEYMSNLRPSRSRFTGLMESYGMRLHLLDDEFMRAVGYLATSQKACEFHTVLHTAERMDSWDPYVISYNTDLSLRETASIMDSIEKWIEFRMSISKVI